MVCVKSVNKVNKLTIYTGQTQITILPKRENAKRTMTFVTIRLFNFIYRTIPNDFKLLVLFSSEQTKNFDSISSNKKN